MPYLSRLLTRSPLPALIISAACASSAASTSAATTFDYDGLIAGVKVGSAHLSVERDASGYRITGQALTNGVARLLSDWRSEFYAQGLIEGGRARLLRYGYDEKQGRKHRILSLEDGQVRQISDGRTRPPRPALEGLDVLSAFFLEGGCWQRRSLHTGRRAYLIEGRSSPGGGACDFRILDEDGDRDRVRVVFEQRDGLRVPVRVTTRGWIRGVVLLREQHPAVPGGVDSRSGDADGGRASGAHFVEYGRQGVDVHLHVLETTHTDT